MKKALSYLLQYISTDQQQYADAVPGDHNSSQRNSWFSLVCSCKISPSFVTGENWQRYLAHTWLLVVNTRVLTGCQYYLAPCLHFSYFHTNILFPLKFSFIRKFSSIFNVIFPPIWLDNNIIIIIIIIIIIMLE